MHIDHKQLVELLIETSGQPQEKVEKQVEELIKEISQAVADVKPMKIEGFGIFSGIGGRILFIPSKELETEINFKYVGMEPIELDEGQIVTEPEQEEDPFEALQDEISTSAEGRDPFAGLIEDFDEEDKGAEDAEDQLIFGVESEKNLDSGSEEEEEAPGPESWGIDAHREGTESANKLISSLMGEEYSQEESAEPEEASEEKVEDDSFEDIFGEEETNEASENIETEEEESIRGLDAELASLMGDDSSVASSEELEAGIYEEDISDVFSEIEEPETEEEPEPEPESEEEEVEEETIDEIVDEINTEELEAALAEPEPEEEPETEEEPEPEPESEEEVEEEIPVVEEEPESEEEPEPAETVEDDFEDFDDPFLDLDEGEDEELEEQSAASDEEEVIPVIKNITSGVVAKKEEPKEKEEEKPKKEKKPKPPKREPKPAPVWLWIILFLVIIVGGTAGLGYFGILNIPGITPESYIANNEQQPPAQPPQQQAPPQVQPQQQEEAPAETEQQTPIQQETTPSPPVQQPVSTPQNVPEGQELYGLTGVVSEAANDGFTIVLFSLSIEQNAYAKQQELSNAGYRAFVTPVPSTQYGTLWRVSIGQFASLRDAAIGAEGMPSEYQQSYFIKRITN